LSSESTVRQVLALTSAKRQSKLKASKTIDVLKISFPESTAVDDFSKVRNELEKFLNERGIPYSYCGIFARCDSDFAKYQERLSKLQLRLMKKDVWERIKERVDQNFFAAAGRSQSKKISFKSKLKRLELVLEEIDPRNCMTLNELEDLYKRMELDEDCDWNSRMTEVMNEAISRCPTPRSVEMLSAAQDATIEADAVICPPLSRKRKLDFYGFKV
jgi:hypothetical protein